MEKMLRGDHRAINRYLRWPILALSLLLVLAAGIHPVAAGESEVLTPSGRTLEEVLADFEAYAEQAMADWQVPGMAVAIVENDRLVYTRGFGVKEYGKDDPVTEYTIFQIGSTSKAFTAALLAMLVDEGKVSWHDRVIDHLPDFRMYDPWVTREFMVKDLMAQHSGLPGYEGDFLSFLGFDRNHIVHSLRYFQPVSSFRSEFAYQNTLFLVAAQLIEKLSGKSWEEMLEERIFSPLGMNHSFSDISGYLLNPEAALSHVHENGEPLVLPMDWPFHFWIDTYSPAGGIHSNVVDMAQWLRLMLNHGTFEEKELLDENQAHYLHSPQTPIHTHGPNSRYSAYCQAWVRTRYQPYDLVWHDGGTTGMTTVVKMVPDQGLGIVVLTNLGGHSLPHSVAYYLVDRYLGNPFRDWSRERLDARVPDEPQPEPPAAPPMPLDLYIGNYTNPVYGNAIVAEEEGTLKIYIGPRATTLYLQPWSRDSFIGEIEHLKDSDTIIDFHFSGGEPQAQSFLIHLLHTAGCGEWIRVDQ